MDGWIEFKILANILYEANLFYVNLWCCDIINILFCLDNFFCLDRSSTKFLQTFCMVSSEALLNDVTAHGQ